MFQRLKRKWKVSNRQLFLIFCVFALTGTVTAYLTRQITTWLHLTAADPTFWLFKMAVLVFGYQVILLIVSLPFGQFAFFRNLERKALHRILNLLRFRKPR